MHPNAYLRTFWRGTIQPQIFVAMSFDDAYKKRFDEIIKPAIEAIEHRGVRLKAYRVDLSKSGDSILTDIAEGIAHSAMVLADVSTVGNDSKTGNRYRNGNVMYEVGLALACRQSAEVLLIRDDQDKFLFDVSTVPHKHLDFSDASKARSELAQELVNRLREVNLLQDARVQMAVASLTGQERQLISAFAKYPMKSEFWLTEEALATLSTIPRLLDKQLIKTAGITHDNYAMFRWTTLGRAIADNIDALVPVRNFQPVETASSTENDTNAEPKS